MLDDGPTHASAIMYEDSGAIIETEILTSRCNAASLEYIKVLSSEETNIMFYRHARSNDVQEPSPSGRDGMGNYDLPPGTDLE
jgi:hypothetical protein